MTTKQEHANELRRERDWCTSKPGLIRTILDRLTTDLATYIDTGDLGGISNVYADLVSLRCRMDNVDSLFSLHWAMMHREWDAQPDTQEVSTPATLRLHVPETSDTTSV